jgi:ATP citrate (pro-S)-lyase
MQTHVLLPVQKVVVKPDQLIKRRGQLGLVKIGSPDEARAWLAEHQNKEVLVGKTRGRLRSFIIEPFVVAGTEMYVAIYSEREHDTILFYHEGGVDVGDVDAKVGRLSF